VYIYIYTWLGPVAREKKKDLDNVSGSGYDDRGPLHMGNVIWLLREHKYKGGPGVHQVMSNKALNKPQTAVVGMNRRVSSL